MIKKTFILIIKVYRKYISPYKMKKTCIYNPTCSLYAIQSLEKYGLLKGIYLIIKRVIRCHPFAKGGYDPVP